MRDLQRRDFKRIVDALDAIQPNTWTLRRGRLITARMPSGRAFYVDRDWWGWTAFTCASMTSLRHEDLRHVGHTKDEQVRPGEQQVDLDAMLIASMYERALADPRNATITWLPTGSVDPDLASTSRERHTIDRLAQHIGDRERARLANQ